MDHMTGRLLPVAVWSNYNAKQEAQLLQRGRACFMSLNISLSYSRSWIHSIDRIRVSIGVPSIVTMVLSCIISEIKRGIDRKSRFFHTPPAFNAPARGGGGVAVEILL